MLCGTAPFGLVIWIALYPLIIPSYLCHDLALILDMKYLSSKYKIILLLVFSLIDLYILYLAVDGWCFTALYPRTLNNV